MSRTSSRKSTDPKLRKKISGGRAYGVVTLKDHLGRRRDVCCGTWGEEETRAKYERQLLEWKAQAKSFAASQPNELTIAELILRFKAWAENHYRNPDGSISSEVRDYALSLRPVRILYGNTLAKDFGPLALEAVRQHMIETPVMRKRQRRDAEGNVMEDADGNPIWEEYHVATGLTRKLINQRIRRIKRAFSWAIEKQLFRAEKDAQVYTLNHFKGLQPGRGGARERPTVKPVHEALVRDTLAHLPRVVAAMVELQLASGMRPGEVVQMRGEDIDMTGPTTWIYRPQQHKGKWRGEDYERRICLGPKAQAIIKPWLRLQTTEYLFQPREAVEAHHAARKEKRLTPVTPSQAARRRKRKPQKAPGECYTTATYGRAITRACLKNGIERWHLHQLRHLAALKAERAGGLDQARAFLGHATPAQTAMYAQHDLEAAAAVAAKIG